MPTTERINFQEVSMLSSGLCLLSRLVGAAIAPDNYGSFQDPDQLVIPSSNVGTVLTFPHVIDDYIYVDIAISGGVSGIYAFSPEAAFGCVGGIVNVENGQYVVRLPYVGAIHSLLFQLKDYRVKSITVGYLSGYEEEPVIDAAQFVISPTVGWTVFAGGVTANVNPGATLRGYFDPNLLAGYVGKVYITTEAASGLPLVIPGVTIFDGETSFSYFTFNPFSRIFSADPRLGYIELVNTTAEVISFSIFTRVISFKALSTVYGNN